MTTLPAPPARRAVPRPPPRLTRRELAVPLGLVLLALVPLLAGGARIAELVGRPVVTEANARFVDDPVPIVLHVVGVTLFALLGALQVAGGVRRRWPRWHRLAGRVALPAGVATAVSGLWMTVAYDKPANVGPLLTGVRLAVGTAMLVALALAVRSLVARRFGQHGAWMLRAYALALGAGTQVFFAGPWLAVAGREARLGYELLMTAAWVFNVAVAEVVIRRHRRSRRT